MSPIAYLHPTGIIMKNRASRLSPARCGVPAPLLVTTAIALVLAVSACGKQDDGRTAGQQLDSAIAKTGQAAEQARGKTEQTLASTGAALKDATQNAETSAQALASKAGEKLDDLAITAAVLAGFAKDSDLSILKIKVETRNGLVSLSGSAPSEAAREKASVMAKAVKGVSSVENKLLVSPG
ncbi:MAG: BON domain-containing protein [Polaromonas sp.]|nr:BON domain-containing protein [Polaromonas sp.]